MNFFIEIDDTKNIIVHESNCKEIDALRKIYIPNFYETYDEAWAHANRKELIYEYNSKDCNCCNPGDWVSI